jgi:hypothetical protein
MRISLTKLSLHRNHHWNRGAGLFASLAIAVAGLASTASAETITVVPDGLVAGDTCRLVFVTADL